MFQTEGRCKPLSRFMELLLFLISMASIFLSSQYPCTDFTTLTSFQSCCDGSLLRGPQCHCWGHSSLWPVCALPYGSSGFSLIPLCTHGRSCYRGSCTQPLSSCHQVDMTSLSSGFTSGCMLRWRRSGPWSKPWCKWSQKYILTRVWSRIQNILTTVASLLTDSPCSDQSLYSVHPSITDSSSYWSNTFSISWLQTLWMPSNGQ